MKLPTKMSLLLAAALAGFGAVQAAEFPPGWGDGSTEWWERATPAQIKRFLAGGADVHARTELFGLTPLHGAAENNSNERVLEALIGSGADVNARDKGGSTPLHLAAWNNSNEQVLKALIGSGADVHAREEGGLTPLHLAAGNNSNEQVLKALIGSGADVHARVEGGLTPLHLAALQSKNPAVIEALLNAGADPKLRDYDGKLPADYAAENEHIKDSKAHRRLLEASY